MIRKIWDYMRGYPKRVVELEKVVRNLEDELGTKKDRPFAFMLPLFYDGGEKKENRSRRMEKLEEKIDLIIEYLKVEKRIVQEKTSYRKIKKRQIKI